MRGTILDLTSFYRNDLDLTQLEASVDVWRLFNTSTTAQVVERIHQSQVVVTNKVKLTDDIMAQSPELKLICVAATGYNNVDIEAAKQREIKVCNVRDYASPAVVQHVFSLTLALITKMFDYRQAVKKGDWYDSEHFCLLDYPITELSGKTMGIVGYGVLGQAVEKVASAFGLKVLIAERPSTSPRPGRTAFDDVLEQADVLTLHCPLTPETQNLIDEKQLQQMKSSSLLINTARGGIVNEEALLKALQSGEIAGAGIDVLSEEPPLVGNELIESALPNLIITPHIAWASRESRQRMVDQLTENILAFKQGVVKNSLI